MSEYNPYTLQGKTILITGASSGIGRTAAVECSKLGAKVIITARNEERLAETLKYLEGEGHEYRICDLTDSKSLTQLVASLPEVQGLINNAGFTKTSPIAFINEGDLQALLKVNTIAPILLMKELVKKKKLKKNSSVVFTSSIAGIIRSSVGNAMYASTKGAISAFVRVAAKEMSAKSIRVNAVCPAMVDTGILESSGITPEQLEIDKQNYPLKRYGTPKDVAWAMIYLLSDASSWVTGVNMLVDGGISIN